jgi:hypothetical protein
VERAQGELALSQQADLLSLSRSSLYYQPRLPSAQEVRLKHRIDEVYTQSPFYGARKIAAQLERDQMGINRKTVARYMQEMGIAAIYPRPQSLVNGTTRKECIRIYCATTRARTPIICGASILRIYAYEPVGCTWWPSWTGTRATW